MVGTGVSQIFIFTIIDTLRRLDHTSHTDSLKIESVNCWSRNYFNSSLVGNISKELN